MDRNLLTYLEGFVTERRKQLFRNILDQRTRYFTVVLEDVFQAHNASAVVRSCDVFGIQDIHFIENIYTHRVSRYVAKGSQKWIDLHRYYEDGNNTNRCLNSLKQKGYQIIATTPHHESSLLHNFNFTKKTAFVFGAEKKGISNCVKKQADGFLKIPMVGFTESLNISVAVSIILQNVTTKLRNSELNWQLSAKEKDVLYADWLHKTIKNIEKIKQHYIENIQEKE